MKFRPGPARRVRHDLALALDLHPVLRVRQRLPHDAFDRDRAPSCLARVLLTRSTSPGPRQEPARAPAEPTPDSCDVAPATVRCVSTSGPAFVTATVCSKCADRLPSLVTAVQPSASTFTAGPADVHHRLDRQHHALGQPRSAARLAVVRNLRLLVQRRADAVADELAHHREPVRLDVLLDRVPDVRDPAAEPHLLDPLVAALPASPAAASRPPSDDPADRHRHRRVAVEAVQLHAHVERDDVSLDERRAPTGSRAPPARSPTRTACRIPAVALERRLGARRRGPAARPRRRDPPSSRRARPCRRARPARRPPARSPRASARSRRATCRRSQRRSARGSSSARSSAASTAPVTTSGGRLPSIAVNDRPGRVVLDERLGLPLIDLQPLAHDVDPVVHARDQRAAALLAGGLSSPAPRSIRTCRRSAASPAAARARPRARRCRARPAARGRRPSDRAPSACTTVRGNPSSTNPRRASSRSSRSWTIPIMTSSPTRLPGLHRLPSPRSRRRCPPAPPRAGCRPSRSSAAAASATAAPPAFPCPPRAVRASRHSAPQAASCCTPTYWPRRPRIRVFFMKPS